MAKLPKSVINLPVTYKGIPVHEFMEKEGYGLVSRGKVRDTYDLGDGHYAVVASDRISIFDFVLPAIVPGKGETLTALTNFWLTEVLSPFRHHLIDGRDRYDILPDLPLKRTLAVWRAKVQRFELIYRVHLGGSVWKSYVESGWVAGQQLPAGINKWDELDEPLFTPSTKSDTGHDDNINFDEYFAQTGELGDKTYWALKAAYQTAYQYAYNRGVLILDTKFEASEEPWMIVDEILTPDSSRFTTVEDFKKARAEKRDPVFYDKEPVRDWGRTVETPFFDNDGNPIVGINKLDPSNKKHVAFVHSLHVPGDVIYATTERYRQIFEMLVGTPLEPYQRNYLGINR